MIKLIAIFVPKSIYNDTTSSINSRLSLNIACQRDAKFVEKILLVITLQEGQTYFALGPEGH